MALSKINSDSVEAPMGFGTTSPNSGAKVTIANAGNQLYFQDTRNANGATGLITYNQDGNFYYDANTTASATNGGHVWRTQGSQTMSLSSAGAFSVPAGSLQGYTLSHSTTNGSAGSGSPTSTKIVRVGDNMYEYSFYFYASTGGYPTCPNSYWVLCPVQKQNSGNLSWSEVEIRGVHRGMWGGASYDEYASIVVGTGSDGGGIWVKEWRNGTSNDSSNRIRVGWMNYDGVYNEGTNYNTGYNLAGWTGNTIGNSYYKMPLFLKIYTNCGADKEYYITVRTTDISGLAPPYKGPMWLTPNTNPTSGIYW